MTAAPQSPLLERVAKAIEPELEAFGCSQSEMEIEAYGYAPEAIAQAALEACQAERLLATLREHIAAADQCTEGGGDLAVMLRFGAADKAARALVADMEGRFTPTYGLGFCPICGAPGLRREKRPGGDDQCEAGHSYPSSSAIPAKLGGAA